jgi:predicted nucleotidyltransferase
LIGSIISMPEVRLYLEQRQEILAYLQAKLEPHPHVHALWLEGADARNKVDEYSDIDLWLDVEDGHEESVLLKLEQHHLIWFTKNPLFIRR